jgi:hypothetical protein
LTELISAGCGACNPQINSIWNKEEMPDEWKEGVYYCSSTQVGDKTD